MTLRIVGHNMGILIPAKLMKQLSGLIPESI